MEQPKSIPDRNRLMEELLNENGVPTPSPTPTPAPPPRSLGALLARLLGLGG